MLLIKMILGLFLLAGVVSNKTFRFKFLVVYLPNIASISQHLPNSWLSLHVECHILSRVSMRDHTRRDLDMTFLSICHVVHGIVTTRIYTHTHTHANFLQHLVGPSW